MTKVLKSAQNDVVAESMADIDARIKHTFSVLSKVANGVINRHIKSAIISGAPGCGKTYLLEAALSAAAREEKIRYESVKGSMSAIGLFRSLWECSGEDCVLVIDDCDSIFGDIDALNLLKAALDTGKSRKVHWNKESRVLNEEGIPRNFEFKGAVVFITNIDFANEIERETKMSPHYDALLSRSLYLDLGIHNKREVLVRIGQVIYSDTFLRENGVTKDAAKEMMAWLTANLARVRVLSIRTILQLVQLVKTDGDWKDMAEAIVLRR
jgi:hypothetical protein